MSDFPPPPLFEGADRALWLAAVERALKGADFDALVARTLDGIAIEPLYGPAPGAPLGAAARRRGPWKVIERIDQPDAAAAAALAALDGGADGVALVLEGAASARGFGLPLAAMPAVLEELLQQLLRSNFALRLDAGPHGEHAVEALFEAAGDDLAAVDIELVLDPIGTASASPSDVAGALTKRIVRRGFTGPILAADGRPHHDAGASEAQELAAVVSTGIACLRALEAAGLPLEAARRRLSFTLAADADAFPTLAKMRALRRLWARVETSCGLSPEPIRLHAETAWRMTTRQDCWNDIVRATIATAAAGLGGADSIAVLPFTSALGLADGFARRIARNTQTILLYEAKLGRVADPAAGSGAIEALTAALDETAWALMRQIEAEGGIAASMAAGALPGRIAATRAARQAEIATGRRPIVGVTVHPPENAARPAVAMPLGRDAAGGRLRAAAPFEAGENR